MQRVYLRENVAVLKKKLKKVVAVVYKNNTQATLFYKLNSGKTLSQRLLTVERERGEGESEREREREREREGGEREKERESSS